MTTIDCREENITLTCPFCFGTVAKIFSHLEATPYRGDFIFCRGCGNTGVLRDRTTYRFGWTVKKPTWLERKQIASHQVLQAIVRDFNSERFVRSAQGKTL